MELTLGFFAVAIPAVLYAGISKGGFGSGAAFGAAVLLALVVPPGDALAVMLPLLMLMDVTALRPYWREWDGEAARVLILGAAPGVALAALVYTIVAPEVFGLLIGLIALGFVAFQMARARGWLRVEGLPAGRIAGACWGLAAGFTSFISHAGGPPAAVYLLSRKVAKTDYQATTVIVFWAVNLMKFVPYAGLGIFTPTSLMAGVILSPFAVIGIWLGVIAHRRIPERLFFAVTYLMLLASGARLVWGALA
ncbi:sulfite exporter TauE/SafE family protein [Palleronia pelagia]|uniref:Probable membrane transporter protein n=1 Tax=Palleronia pelagia TaxID=387096 RepID=A0A1H8GFK6_9RHOB|nr:sulfite exporter TauE/SafE family protein [Palleronia pelagia]SEN42743.1 hypothetical protein SAMN04488011_10460 [Palleronia pelagia]